MDNTLTDYALKMELLRIFADTSSSGNRSAHKINVIGRPSQLGALEGRMGRKLSNSERSRAGICVQELVRLELLEPTYMDLADPEGWLRVTARGREALSRGTLDELDAALHRLAPSLVELRQGVWSAATSSAPDSPRHAAHSARELLRQVLDAVAPIEEVRTQSWFQPDKSSRSGITRRMRVRLALQKRGLGNSERDRKVVESAMALISDLYDKLSAEAHLEAGNRQVLDCLRLAEAALGILLVDGGRALQP